MRDLDDEVEVTLEFEAVGGEDGLEEAAKMEVDGAGVLRAEGGAVAGAYNCDTAEGAVDIPL